MPYSRKPVTLFSTPLRGIKNKKTESVFNINHLELAPRHLHPSGKRETPRGYWKESRLILPFTGVSALLLKVCHSVQYPPEGCSLQYHLEWCSFQYPSESVAYLRYGEKDRRNGERYYLKPSLTTKIIRNIILEISNE